MPSAVQELLHHLADVDSRAAVWCASLCARTALEALSSDEPRLQQGLALAESWTRGQATERACLAAFHDAGAVLDELHAVSWAQAQVVQRPHLGVLAASGALSGSGSRPDPSASAARIAAADAVGAVLEATVSRACWCGHSCAQAAGHAANAVATSADRGGAWRRWFRPETVDFAEPGAGDPLDPWSEARAAHLERSLHQVRAEPWSLTIPSREAIDTHPRPGVGVAWDALAHRAGPGTSIAGLLEAHGCAERLGLDWSDPLERAVAERVADEVYVGRLLGG